MLAKFLVIQFISYQPFFLLNSAVSLNQDGEKSRKCQTFVTQRTNHLILSFGSDMKPTDLYLMTFIEIYIFDHIGL